ncbi:MAG: MFS transporter, partial [Verrucomicrobiia bacterium]
ALSRSLFTRLIPEGRAGGWFGFYNLLGRFAAILGPMLMALVSRASGEPRLGILAVSGLFLIGGAILLAVRVERGAQEPEVS